MARGKIKKSKKSASGAPDGFSDSSWNKLSETWRDSIMAMKTEEVEQDIIRAVRVVSGQTNDLKNDPKIKVLADDLKLLKSAYTEVIGEARAQIDFCIYTLNTRGTVVKPPKLASVDDEDE